MSNWEAWNLSAPQIQYAALDAIITGHIFRGLRLWHASPSACTSCRRPLGAVRNPYPYPYALVNVPPFLPVGAPLKQWGAALPAGMHIHAARSSQPAPPAPEDEPFPGVP